MPQLKDIVQFLNETLNISKVADDSINGLQVEGAQEVRKIVLGVDASMELFEKAESFGADLVIVHHGLFWKGKDCMPVGIMARRLKYLLEHGISLYAAHFPLDMHKDFGNNAQMAAKLGLKKTRPFAKDSGGNPVGVIGEFSNDVLVDVSISKIESAIGTILRKELFGRTGIRRVAIVSGGGTPYMEEAAKEGVDLFLTGETKHIAANNSKELKLNAVYAGHYATETFGVVALGKALENRFKGLKAEFINCPTGL